MTANFRIILFCVALILAPNLIKPSDSLSTEADFKLSFCPFVSFFDSAPKIEDGTFGSCFKFVNDFGKRIFKFSNGLNNFRPFVSDINLSVTDNNSKEGNHDTDGPCWIFNKEVVQWFPLLVAFIFTLWRIFENNRLT